ncbi:hypothetical protein LXA43DRAFT_885698 [Ganoderma leucocontextum]|nr:hypothetical protein LXA43DRAFT_885698 [Ganoderma leucocontextum]
MPAEDISGYTLMVAGRRTGKTSFLRLLLDTSTVSSFVTSDQLASVAKFVQGCSGHTAHVRSVSVDIDLAPDEVDEEFPLTLTLIDTPSLDFEDDASSQRAIQEILRHVESRLGESLDDEHRTLAGDHLVHLCVYFLDPDYIVPPSVPAPPVPLVPRARTNSLSTHESEPVILEPPVSNNPMLCRPILPASDITAIRRLSARVNVLPVIARADTLTADRLNAVKMAIRRDLAEAGIGFGIFDLDIPLYAQLESKVAKNKAENGFMKHHLTGNSNSPPSTPITPTLLRLPFSLISPDIYSHSDGVGRPQLSRHELMHQYDPSKHVTVKNQSTPKTALGRFVRNYRWGSLDVMDASHCEFLHLRGAVFHHMETLQKYTREYLFEKFRAEVQPQAPPPAARPTQQPARVDNRLPPMRDSRPILAIETAPAHANGNRHVSMPRSGIVNGHGEQLPVQGLSAAALAELSPKMNTSSRSQRQRAKKITVACNFCRSRKLKCDGGRPACGQCFKRQNPCDYTASNKRRNSGKARKQYGSDSEGDSIEEGTADLDHHPSHSPELSSSAPHSRRSSNVSMLLTDTLPPLSAAVEPREEAPAVLPPINSQAAAAYGVSPASRRPSLNTELPPIATLSAPPRPQEEPPSLVALKQAESAASRRRTSSATSGSVSGSGRGGRGGHGSKIVACNFCRARKTRCDGAHPTCSSCSRRSLRCNYVNDPAAKGRSKSATSGGASPPDVSTSASASSRASPVALTPSIPDTVSMSLVGSRPLSSYDPDMMQAPAKKMRLSHQLSTPPIAVLGQ